MQASLFFPNPDSILELQKQGMEGVEEQIKIIKNMNRCGDDIGSVLEGV